MKRKGSRRPRGAQSPVCAPLPEPRATSLVERGYDTDDRLLRTLFVALCRSMKLEAYRDETRSPTILFVSAPDEATQDHLEQRFRTLSEALDDKLMAVAADFIREHCGLDVPIRPRS